MSKKLLIVVAPLAAIVALAMIPVGAQAVGPHYTKNGAPLVAGKKEKTISWGKLSNKNEAGAEITCENMALANVENPTGGGPGKSETLNFVAVECTLTGCPAHAFARQVPGSLPWNGELITEGGLIRADTGLSGGVELVGKGAVHIFLGCEEKEGGPIFVAEEYETNVGNQQKPITLNGFSGCNKPGELEFDAGSGTLETTGPGKKGKTTKNLKSCGYLKQDLIGTEP